MVISEPCLFKLDPAKPILISCNNFDPCQIQLEYYLKMVDTLITCWQKKATCSRPYGLSKYEWKNELWWILYLTINTAHNIVEMCFKRSKRMINRNLCMDSRRSVCKLLLCKTWDTKSCKIDDIQAIANSTIFRKHLENASKLTFIYLHLRNGSELKRKSKI